MAEHFARELRRAVGRGEPAEGPAVLPARAVRQPGGGLDEAVCFAVPPGPQVEEAVFGTLAQSIDVDAGRDREQHVAHADALADREALRVGRVIALARRLVGFRPDEFVVEQLLDGDRGRLAGDAAHRGRVVGRQPAGADRRLAQKFDARAAAQLLRGQGLVGGGQRHAVDGRGGGAGGRRVQRGGRVHHEVRPGRFWPAGTLMRRERTIWYGRNT